jgi:hypothetical protein
MPDLRLATNHQYVTLTGTGFEAVFGKADGLLTAYRAQGRDLLTSGPHENYLRAPTDIDLLCGNPPAAIHKWRAAGLDRLERRVIWFEAVQISPKLASVTVQARICAADQPTGFDSEITYHVFGNGEIAITNTVTVEDRPPLLPTEGINWMPPEWLADARWKYYIPRVGVELHLPGTLEALTWYGRGPQENYSDRKLGAAVGVYQSTVSAQFTPYVYPGECGGKEDTRWLALRDRDGNGLLVVGMDHLHFDALHYSIRDLTEAKHIVALQPRDEVILHLDARHMGVGGDDGWMAPVHREFLVYPGLYRYAFKLMPLTGQDDPATLARMKIEGGF